MRSRPLAGSMMFEISRLYKERHRKYVLGAILAACIIIALYVNLYQGIDVVYTHFFYVPIILAGLWYYKKAIYLAIFFGLYHIAIGFYLSGTIVPSTLIRAAMFLTVALVIGSLSEQKDRLYERTRSSEQSLKAILNGVYDAIFIHDLDGRIVDVNDRMLDMYGVTRDQAINLSIKKDYSSPMNPVDELKNKWEEVMSGKDQLFEWIARRPKDGSVFYAEVYLRRILINRRALILATVRDISRRKRAEDELQEARKRAELYIDLMGHDINNMNQIGIAYLEMALEKFKPDRDDRVYLQKPLDALKNSSKLIENVRKIQQIKAGVHEHKIVDLCKLLSEVRNEYAVVPDRDVTINYQPCSGRFIRADLLLKDAFANLVGNAIKHSSGRLTINITLDQVIEAGRPHYKVAVEDNGPGIPDEVKSKLFRRLQRGDTKAEGSGMGLYLVKMLVDDTGGRVWIEDRVPGDHTKGSKFLVLLPVADQ